jgi:malonyl-CoA O-methyltransferase
VSEADPFALEAAAVRRHFERASTAYDAHAVLQARVREEMLGRLGLLAFEPGVVVDLGAGTGHAARALKRRWPRARVIALDRAAGMLAAARAQNPWLRGFGRVRGEALRLPLRPGAVDLAFSCLMLPWVGDLAAALAEVRRALSPRGYFSFATLGPDTLTEVRAAWAEVDAAPHVHRFLDLHDVGDALVRAGFADPVMDVDRFRLTYRSTRALIDELRAVGGGNALVSRRAGLTGRRRFAAFESAFERLREADGRLPVTVEVVYGQAWCPGGTPPVRGRRGETVIPIESLRRR